MCTDVDTPYEGCTAAECTDVDTPYTGCTVPDCTTDADTPYTGCTDTPAKDSGAMALAPLLGAVVSAAVAV